MSDTARFAFVPGAPDYPTIVGGQGCHLITADGRRILDGAGGAIVGNIGWGRAEVADAAREAMAGLMPGYDPLLLASWAPVSVPTGRVRASVTAGMRFFGNALFLGMTRPVDQAAPWKGLVGFGQVW